MTSIQQNSAAISAELKEQDYGKWGEHEQLVYKDDDFVIVRCPANTKTGFVYEVVPVDEDCHRLDDWEICPEPDTFDEAVEVVKKHRREVKNYKARKKKAYAAENGLSYKEYAEAIAGEGWAINDYKDMETKATTDKEREVLSHIRKEEEEHLDELVELMDKCDMVPDEHAYAAVHPWHGRPHETVEKVPACPKCGAEIDHLDNWVSGEAKYWFTVNENGKIDYEKARDFEPDYETNDYECPECSEVVFRDEEEAKNFLLGEDAAAIHPARVAEKKDCPHGPFFAKQKQYWDVIVDKNNDYIRSIECDDTDAPYGPYLCLKCKVERPELSDFGCAAIHPAHLPPKDKRYKIVRFHRDGPDELIMGGLTLEEAKAHCQREDTHGEDWFDGYMEEPDEENSYYIIKSVTEVDEETGAPLYWSDGEGWTVFEGATWFTYEETQFYDLPVGGEWLGTGIQCLDKMTAIHPWQLPPRPDPNPLTNIVTHRYPYHESPSSNKGLVKRFGEGRKHGVGNHMSFEDDILFSYAEPIARRYPLKRRGKYRFVVKSRSDYGSSSSDRHCSIAYWVLKDYGSVKKVEPDYVFAAIHPTHLPRPSGPAGKSPDSVQELEKKGRFLDSYRGDEYNLDYYEFENDVWAVRYTTDYLGNVDTVEIVFIGRQNYENEMRIR